jgi:hypothetical protein
MGKKKEVAPAPMAAKSSGGGGGIGLKEAGYREFAKTGGFSPMDLANIRARAVSPVRAVYANAMQNVNRQRALQGGYSPGFGTLQARMAREQGQSTADAATNVEAGISEQVQRGRLAGLAGMQSPSSGSGGSGGAAVPEPEQKKGFWGKLGSGLKKVGKIALPIALGAMTGGVGTLAGAGVSGALKTIGKRAATRISG